MRMHPHVAFLALACALTTCVHAAEPKTLRVAADGSGDYKTVQSAVDAVPAKNTERTVIQIKAGTYKEHVEIPKDKPFITFRGDGSAKTILTDDKNVNFVDAAGKKITTQNSSSTWVRASDFVAENLTFENTAGNHGQALAMYHDADRGSFRDCRFVGWQDTLRVNFGRSYFKDCYIEGHVDFIYGKGVAVFENCHIHCVADGYITAGATDENVPFGYVFLNCKVTAADAVKRTYLGRPWRPFAAVTYINTELPAQIDPAGWDNWGKEENEKTARFAEYHSTGPGANPAKRAPWSKQLTEAEAKAIDVDKILAGDDGWKPDRK